MSLSEEVANVKYCVNEYLFQLFKQRILITYYEDKLYRVLSNLKLEDFTHELTISNFKDMEGQVKQYLSTICTDGLTKNTVLDYLEITYGRYKKPELWKLTEEEITGFDKDINENYLRKLWESHKINDTYNHECIHNIDELHNMTVKRENDISEIFTVIDDGYPNQLLPTNTESNLNTDSFHEEDFLLETDDEDTVPNKKMKLDDDEK